MSATTTTTTDASLTDGGCHLKITKTAVEQDERETLKLRLVGRGLVDAVTSGLEVPTRHNLQRLANVDNEGSRLVRNVVPRLVIAPDLETRHGYREEQGGSSKVGVAMHTQTLGLFNGLLLDWTEQGVSEVALTARAAVTLNVLPEVVVRKLEDTREEAEQAAIDRPRQVVGKGCDFVHEGVKAGRHILEVVPFPRVPVELFDAIGLATLALPSGEGTTFTTNLKPERVLVSGPAASVGVEEKAFLVLFANVVVHVLCECKLAMQLSLLAERHRE